MKAVLAIVFLIGVYTTIGIGLYKLVLFIWS
jgi:hypothetical protein